MILKPEFMATSLQILPHRDMAAACQLVVRNFPEAPFGPVLTRSLRRWIEKVPCLKIDREKRQLSFETTGRENELVEFYDRVLARDVDYFAVSRELDPGLYSLTAMYRQKPWHGLKLVSFDVPGLYSVGLSIKDESGTPALYNDTCRDVLLKALGMKAKWYNRKVKELFPGVRTHCFVGNGGLSVLLSAGGTGGWERVKNDYNELIAAAGADMSSIHCCANFDWSLLMQTSTDGINFDAYQYGDTMSLYPETLKAFLERGGAISWGIIPTAGGGGDITRESPESLVERLERVIQSVVDKGIDRQLLMESSWVTPTCEPATLPVELAETVCRYTREVSERLRAKYFAR